MNKLNRLFLAQPLQVGEFVSLNSEHSHYLANVLRKKAQEFILIFNGEAEYSAELLEVTKKRVAISIIKKTRTLIEKPYKLCLYYSPIKNADTSFIVQKATELGVDYIQPIKFTRTVVNKINIERAQKIAIEAAEQSERLDIPVIQEIISFKNIKWPDAIIIFCNELEIQQRISLLPLTILQGIKELVVVIGPEGGFSEEERNFLLKHKNSYSVTLGCNILRTETAIITALVLTNELLINHL